MVHDGRPVPTGKVSEIVLLLLPVTGMVSSVVPVEYGDYSYEVRKILLIKHVIGEIIQVITW